MNSNIDRAADIIAETIWTDDGTVRGTVMEAAQALADAGLLTPAPQIIRTVEELQDLDPDTVAINRDDDETFAYQAQKSIRNFGTESMYYDFPPAVVVAPAAQVRAARKALEEA